MTVEFLDEVVDKTFEEEENPSYFDNDEESVAADDDNLLTTLLLSCIFYVSPPSLIRIPMFFSVNLVYVLFDSVYKKYGKLYSTW